MPYIDYGSTVAVCVSHWGSYCNIEAARSPLLYRRSWLLSLGTPEQNFSGTSQMIYDIFTYVKSFFLVFFGLFVCRRGDTYYSITAGARQGS